jgi:hypothetical protein
MIELYIIWEKTKSFAHAQNVQMWEFSILTMQYLAYYYEWHLGNWPSCIAEIYKHSLNVVQYLLLHRSMEVYTNTNTYQNEIVLTFL